MTPEQKKRIAHEISNWKNANSGGNFTDAQVTGYRMAALLLERKTLRQAAQQMHDDGVPLHVALRTLAGRKTCN